MLFGVSSWHDSSPTLLAAALWRAAAKDMPSSLLSSAFISFTNSGSRSISASCSNGSVSPHSEPKLKCVTTPVAPKSPTAPRAKPSAEDSVHGRGSSSTRSTPQFIAASALANFEYTAACPRWIKSPDMTHTTGQSSPRVRTVSVRWCSWPK